MHWGKRVSKAVKWLSLPFFLVLIVGQAVARVWYGVHFVSDTVASVLLGLVFVAALIVWHSAAKFSLQEAIISRWFWLSVTLVVGIVAGLSLAPLHTYLFAILLGIVLSVELIPQSPVATTRMMRLKMAGIMLIGLVVIGASVELLADLSSVSLVVLVIRGTGWTLGAIWLIAGSSSLLKRLK